MLRVSKQMVVLRLMFPHSLPKNWRREEQLREGMGMGKLVQTIYWSPEVRTGVHTSNLPILNRSVCVLSSTSILTSKIYI